MIAPADSEQSASILTFPLEDFVAESIHLG